jgi:hypothetical protein
MERLGDDYIRDTPGLCTDCIGDSADFVADDQHNLKPKYHCHWQRIRDSIVDSIATL